MRWDAARAASRRPLTKPRKLHGPVGEYLSSETALSREADERRRRVYIGFGEVTACKDCGYHVCSCDRTTALEALREARVVTIGHPPQDTCPCIDCRHARGQLPSRPVVMTEILRNTSFNEQFPSRQTAEEERPPLTYQSPVGEIKVVRDPYVFGWHFYDPSVPHQFAELHPELARESDRSAQAREVVPALVPDDLTPADAGADAELELRQPPSKP